MNFYTYAKKLQIIKKIPNALNKIERSIYKVSYF